MTPDQARKLARQLDQDLLVAEAEQATLGWAYLTVDGIVIESEPGLERYQQALDAFEEVAAGRQRGYRSTSSCLTFGIRGGAAGESTRGEDASARIAVLHARLDALNRRACSGRSGTSVMAPADTEASLPEPGADRMSIVTRRR